MRYLIRFGLLCYSVIAICHDAQAQSQWYIAGSAGALLRSDSSRSVTLFNALGATGPGTNTTSFDPGPVINLAVGYRLPLGFRVEGELGYAHYAASSDSPFSSNGVFPNLVGNRLGVVSGGDRDDYSATVNAFYDFALPGWVTPYIGAGVGAARDVVQTGIFAGPGVPKFTGRGGSQSFAVVLAEVGLNVAIGPRLAIVPSYRYEHGFGKDPLDANVLKVGLRYSF